MLIKSGPFLERGSFFALLFFGIAPGVALLLLWRGAPRSFREAYRRRRIVLLTLAALAVWAFVSDFMLEMVFGLARELAHTRPFPDGHFPEGWPIYGYLAVYSVVGATLVWVLGTGSSKETPP
jgi:hypothetical protein